MIIKQIGHFVLDLSAWAAGGAFAFLMSMGASDVAQTAIPAASIEELYPWAFGGAFFSSLMTIKVGIEKKATWEAIFLNVALAITGGSLFALGGGSLFLDVLAPGFSVAEVGLNLATLAAAIIGERVLASLWRRSQGAK